MKKMHGDVLRINITPPGQSYPWIHIFVHEYGIKQSGKPASDEIGAFKGKSR